MTYVERTGNQILNREQGITPYSCSKDGEVPKLVKHWWLITPYDLNIDLSLQTIFGFKMCIIYISRQVATAKLHSSVHFLFTKGNNFFNHDAFLVTPSKMRWMFDFVHSIIRYA